MSRKIVFGVAVLVVAYLYTKWNKYGLTELDLQEQSIIEAWNESIVHPNRKFKRIAVGINCNLDLIVSGTALLKSLNQRPGHAEDKASVQSLEDLTSIFAHYFSKGSAAERPFLSQDVYKQVVKAAEQLENKEHYVGGNAALMAVKIAELFPETKVQLVGPIGPMLLELLGSQVTVPSDSIIAEDEVHLIMEYGLNEEWEGLTAPVANRFITAYDDSNSRITMLDKYFSDSLQFDPDLVLFSGLHLLESQPPLFVKDKLLEVSLGLEGIDPSVPVHLELASMANHDLVKMIFKNIVPRVTSLGLNEQELTFAAHAGGGPHADYYMTRTGQPEIHKISDMIGWVLSTYGHSKKNKESRLTRVHFHSLTYHIVGTVPKAWSNTKSAVAAGTRMAGRQACNVLQLSPTDIELRIPQTFKLFTGDVVRQFNESKPVLSWERSGFKFAFSPVLVCSAPMKTVGLGDAISATGLMYSEFDSSYR